MEDIVVVAYVVAMIGATFTSWLARFIYRAGHSIAWGVVDGVHYSRRERVRRFVTIWVPSAVTFVWAIFATVFALVDLSESVDGVSSMVSVRFLIYSVGALAIFASISLCVNGFFLLRRVRAGKLGFVDGGQSQQE